jgi:hypothetical protein
MKTGYAGIMLGANGTVVKDRFVNEEDKEISIDLSSASGTEMYLLGLSNLSSLGDLSNKYPYNVMAASGDNNLKEFILGNHNKNYYNPNWSGDSEINLNGFKYLEYFNLENCDTFKGNVKLDNCPSIKRILLNGSNASGLNIPVSGVIEELRIPPSVNIFTIDSHYSLTNDNFTIGNYIYED